MQLNIKPLVSTLLLVMCLSACQRVIDVNIDDTSQKLVVEGNLTDVTGTQSVIISRSVPYNSTNVYPTVSGAMVTITDQSIGKVYKMPESSKAGTYSIASFKGKAYVPYTLTVTADGKTYSATSTMPFPVGLDSLTMSSQIIGSTTVKTVSVNYHDPIGVANQYKYVMYVNGVEVKRIFVDNDNLSDGRAVSSMLYQRDIDLKTGDKIIVEMQCIDPFMYTYWDNLSNQGGNSPSDSATPLIRQQIFIITMY